MLTGTTTGLDLNMTRAIEELAHVINEVDQRVQLVKYGLAQSFPHLGSPLGLDRSRFVGNSVGVPSLPVLLPHLQTNFAGWRPVPTFGPTYAPFVDPLARSPIFASAPIATPYAAFPPAFAPFRP